MSKRNWIHVVETEDGEIKYNGIWRMHGRLPSKITFNHHKSEKVVLVENPEDGAPDCWMIRSLEFLPEVIRYYMEQRNWEVVTTLVLDYHSDGVWGMAKPEELDA